MSGDVSFHSVKKAVIWSEEWATRPNITSQIGKLLLRRGSDIPRHELIDIAQTITHITANCKPFKGLAMKCVYRGHSKENDRQLSEILGNKLAAYQTNMMERQRKTPTQLVALSLATIKEMRSRELYNRRYPARRIARAVGVSQQKFIKNTGWVSLHSQARAILKLLIEQAEHEIGLELTTRGWM